MRQLFTLMTAFVALTLAAQTRQYSDLPTLHVMQTGNWQPIDKETYLDCTVDLIDGDSEVNYPDGRIRGRGNSTWVRGTKLPYRLKFRTKYKLLGSNRASAKNWVLMANNFDKTLIRNAVASHVALECGQPFAPGAKFVDMVLDGKFVGNYQITDFLDIRKKRINITEQELPAAQGDNITGGYFLECCYDEMGPDVFWTERGTSIRIKSPDQDVINSEQMAYIRSHIVEFERRLFSKNFTDPVKGYRPMVDSTSLVSWYICGELCMNLDMFWSTNIYKEKDDDHIYFGPVWDFDIAFNNSARAGDVRQSLMFDVGFQQNTGVGSWIHRMMEDPWFEALVKREYKRIVDGGVEEHTLAYINDLATQLDQSQRLNYELYNIGEQYWDEYKLFSTYTAGVEYLKTTFSKHIQFLNSQFNPEAPAPEPEPASFNGLYRIYNVQANMAIGPRDGKVTLYDPEGNHLWRVTPHGDAYRITAPETGLAITGLPDQGSNLTLRTDNPSDSNQLWRIETLENDESTCVVSNVATNWAWNNSNNNAADANPIISWTNDENNSWKTTRQWRFVYVGESALDEIQQHWAVTYSPSAQALRIIAYGYDALQGSVEIYGINGARVFAADAAPEISLSALPKGVYILKVKINNHTETLKLQL